MALEPSSWTASLTAETRLAISNDLINALRTTYSATAAVLCASLVHESDRPTQQTLLSVLLDRIRAGNIEDVLEVARSAKWLHEALLSAVTQDLARISQLDHDHTPGTASADELSSTRHLLRCADQLVSGCDSPELGQTLLSTCLKLVCSTTKQVALAARSSIFSVLTWCGCSERSVQEIRECISSSLLTEHALPFQHTIGLSLWLRLLTSAPLHMLPFVGEEQYWEAITSGLRNGDGERRKLSLEILKLSIRVAAENGRMDLVTNQTVSPTSFINQHIRYCTVFETLALARYQNLLLETKRDLNQLASPSSLVDSRWFYVLLQTALSPSMLDQNRKVVGKWILDNKLRRHGPIEELATFLKQSFLPWAMEGHLFVSTLRLDPDQTWRCDYGDYLSSFVVDMIEDNLAHSGLMLDLHLELFSRGPNKMFLPAVVYIMDGLCRSAHHFSLTIMQAEAILQLSTWQAFPEFAKEFVRRCCCALIQSSNTPAEVFDGLSQTWKTQYEALRAQHNGESGPTTVKTSEREKKVQQALENCLAARESRHADTADKLADMFHDIWSDAEYLVYPRDLLLVIPETILSPRALQLSTADEASAVTLRTTIKHIIRNMLELAETRSYIFAPMTSAIRTAVLTKPQSLQAVDLEEYILNIANTPPQPKTDLQLDYVAAQLLQDRFSSSDEHDRPANSESRAMAMYLDLVSRLHQHQGILRSTAGTIMARWKRQKNPPPTISAFKTTVQLQVLTLCCEQLQQTQAEITQMLDDFYFLLSLEPLPRYRYLLSWITLRLLMRSPQEHNRLLDLLGTKDHHSNPKYLAALIKLAVELTSTKQTSEDFSVQLASIFIALSASSKVAIRHEAQWSFPLFMEIARENQCTLITENQAYLSLETYIRNLPRFDEPPVERIFSRFDPAKHNNMLNLTEGQWTELNDTRPPSTQAKDLHWLAEQDRNQGLDLPARCIPFGEATSLRRWTMPVRGDESSGLTNKQVEQSEEIALQTKGSAYLENLLRGEQTRKSSQHQLIVLASLVTNPYNLGGLSRVSEIFGAQALYVRDPKVVNEKDFISVAVSSHNHIDILQLGEGEIASFLARMKAEGWTAVGVEQTDRSDLLGKVDTRLPAKTILIIGNEREGMPGSVISECDVLVEIPQRGVTRSMNVQTVAAVVLYDFNRQHT